MNLSLRFLFEVYSEYKTSMTEKCHIYQRKTSKHIHEMYISVYVLTSEKD